MQILLIGSRGSTRDDLHELLTSLGFYASTQFDDPYGRGEAGATLGLRHGSQCHDRGKVRPSAAAFPRGRSGTRGRTNEMSTKVEAFGDRLAGRHPGGRIRLRVCVLPCAQAL